MRPQQAPVSGKVFIQRDYSSGTRCQFQTKFPAELENRVRSLACPSPWAWEGSRGGEGRPRPGVCTSAEGHGKTGAEVLYARDPGSTPGYCRDDAAQMPEAARPPRPVGCEPCAAASPFTSHQMVTAEVCPDRNLTSRDGAAERPPLPWVSSWSLLGVVAGRHLLLWPVSHTGVLGVDALAGLGNRFLCASFRAYSGVLVVRIYRAIET